MYLIERMLHWSEFERIFSLSPAKQHPKGGYVARLQVNFNAERGSAHTTSEVQPTLYEVRLDGAGRLIKPDYVVQGMLTSLIQRGCEGRGWSWRLGRDDSGLYRAQVDDVVSQSAQGGLVALLDAYLQRLEQLHAALQSQDSREEP